MKKCAHLYSDGIVAVRKLGDAIVDTLLPEKGGICVSTI